MISKKTGADYGQNYSGDYGDLASFVTHMREIAASKGSDLLLV